METFLTRYYQTFFVVGIAAIAGLAFYVGMLKGEQQKGDSVTLACKGDILAQLTIPTKALSTKGTASDIGPTPSTEIGGVFAGSKNGTKYYTPGCAGLNRIKPENRVWFQSVEDATLQGYTAANC